MLCRKGLILIIVFWCGFSSTKAQNGSCEILRLESKKLLRVLKEEALGFENPRYINKSDLLGTILPEYLTYDMGRNLAEITLIKLYHSLGIESYKRISTGPFQMQLEFIHNNLATIPLNKLKDATLRACKQGGYAVLLEKIDYLNKITTQWEILRCFEYNQYNKYKKLGLTLKLTDFYTIYNKGNIKYADPKWQVPFSKISCKAQSYALWCEEMKKWLITER